MEWRKDFTCGPHIIHHEALRILPAGSAVYGQRCLVGLGGSVSCFRKSGDYVGIMGNRMETTI